MAKRGTDLRYYGNHFFDLKILQPRMMHKVFKVCKCFFWQEREVRFRLWGVYDARPDWPLKPVLAW